MTSQPSFFRTRPSLFRTSLAFATLFLVFTVALGALVACNVKDTELEKSTILARMNEETSIYSQDGSTLMGSFFDSAHRRYIPIDEVPAHMVRALVAAEDKNFYHHMGVDIPATFGAFFDGVLHGFHFRRGASTLTQQTVKNIMGNRERSFSRKIRELIRAYQLEHMYNKSQILEFYLNQFHVTANGNGIGIAAKYYFNKDVSQLTLVEAAFIAGSVKAPAKYNPFNRVTKSDQARALAEANGRKNYVLKRMLEEKWVTQGEYDKGIKESVPFQQGQFRNEEMALVSLISSQMNREEVLSALGLESINELNSAGFKIYTTLDANMQRDAQLAVRRNLSRLDMILHGFKAENPKFYKPQRRLEVGQFFYGKVISVDHRDKEPTIRVDFGLAKGTVSYDAIVRAAAILNIPNYRGEKFNVNEILRRLNPGEVVFTEVKAFDETTGEAQLELRQRPEVNGGLIAVDQGEVRAVIAGFDSLGFNRAMFSTRQPGSVFKSVVFFGALQLGWTILDRLDNERRVFPFQGQYYYPRPEHISPFSDVSMLWAGTKSENVATIYLTDHLLDKLTQGQFKTLLGSMDLLPKSGESANDFHFRVAKATGVQLDNEGVKDYLLSRAINDLKPDLIFSGRIGLMKTLDKMFWGRGYQGELHKLSIAKDRDFPESDRKLRLDLIKNNYLRHTNLAAALTDDWGVVQSKVKALGAKAAWNDPAVTLALNSFRVLGTQGVKRNLGYFRVLTGEDDVSPRPGTMLTEADVEASWSGPEGPSETELSLDEVQLEGILPLAYFTRIKQNLDQHFQQVTNTSDSYKLDQYFQHHDFRTIVGLKYLVNLAHAMGVTSPLVPVLSFGLGTNDVSSAEVAKVYQSFVDGKTYSFYKEGPSNQLSFISKVEDREGKLLYEPKRIEHRLTDSCIASQMGEILRSVVTHGSGGQVHKELFVEPKAEPGAAQLKIRIPSFGKTGTTNDFQTAYYAGFIPYPVQAKSPLSVDHALVMASYVGYDVNRPMRVGGYKIFGGSGALPAWLEFAKSVITTLKYDTFVDTSDISLLARKEWPMLPNTCTTSLQVELPQGTIMSDSGTADNTSDEAAKLPSEIDAEGNDATKNPMTPGLVNYALNSGSNSRDPKRFFKPFDAYRPEDASRELAPTAQGQPTLDKAEQLVPTDTPEPAGPSHDEKATDKGYTEEVLW